MGESGIAYWAYMISMQKTLKDIVEKGFIDQDEADAMSEQLFERMSEDNVAQFRASGRCAEIIRTYLKPNASKDEYISLTEIARDQSAEAPGYLIQSWMRSRNTVEFLKIWEIEHNLMLDAISCDELIGATKTPSFTLTPKQWISKTNAVGLISRQGKNGGTLAHPDIAVDFHMWMEPELRMNLVKWFRKSTLA